MGPPRERGGSPLDADPYDEASIASMGPPRERGGSLMEKDVLTETILLQWGRRVNAAEVALRGLELF